MHGCTPAPGESASAWLPVFIPSVQVVLVMLTWSDRPPECGGQQAFRSHGGSAKYLAPESRRMRGTSPLLGAIRDFVPSKAHPVCPPDFSLSSTRPLSCTIVFPFPVVLFERAT